MEESLLTLDVGKHQFVRRGFFLASVG